MKLTKNQLNALANEVKKKKQNDLDREKRLFWRDKRVIGMARRYAAVYKEIPRKISKKVFYKDGTLISTWLKALEDVYKFKTIIPAHEEVMNNLHILSIDCKSLEDLKKKINAKYK